MTAVPLRNLNVNTRNLLSETPLRWFAVQMKLCDGVPKTHKPPRPKELHINIIFASGMLKTSVASCGHGNAVYCQQVK
jgi:hypothetical protein